MIVTYEYTPANVNRLTVDDGSGGDPVVVTVTEEDAQRLIRALRPNVVAITFDDDGYYRRADLLAARPAPWPPPPVTLSSHNAFCIPLDKTHNSVILRVDTAMGEGGNQHATLSGDGFDEHAQRNGNGGSGAAGAGG